jgi:hypothetical protein
MTPSKIALEEAAKLLAASLFGTARDLGTIGVGTDRIYVYVYGKWPGERPREWMGHPVQWAVEIGEIRALGSV